MIKLLTSIIVMCVCVLCVTPEYAMPVRRALVIGNDSYPGNELHNARNDARGVAEKLRGLNYLTTLVLDVNQRAMSDALGAFGNSIAVGDVAVVYYAGHGLQVDGENYLVPTNFHVADASDVKFQAFSLGQVLETLISHGAATQVIILDACRNNPFLRSRGIGTGWAGVGTSAGTVLAFGTTPGSTASDSSTGTHGLFTNALLRYLDNPSLDIETMLRAVRRDVIQESNGTQVPWMSTSLIGAFYVVSSEDRGDPLLKSSAFVEHEADGSTARRSLDHSYQQPGGSNLSANAEERERVTLGQALDEMRTFNLEDAVGVLKEILVLDPRCSVALRLLGLAFDLMGRPIEAKQILDRAVVLNPDDVQAVAYRCLVNAGQDVALSMADCTKALQEREQAPEALVGLVVNLVSMKMYSEATVKANLIASLWPENTIGASLLEFVVRQQSSESVREMQPHTSLLTVYRKR